MESVCFTGACPKMTRDELVLKAKTKFDVRDSVTKALDILVCDDPMSESSKLEKAMKNGTRIISYWDFFEMLDEDLGFDIEKEKDAQKEKTKSAKQKLAQDFSDADKTLKNILKEHPVENLRVEKYEKDFFLIVPTKDGGVEVCLENSKAKKWSQTLPDFLEKANYASTAKELREYMAEKKLSDTGKKRIKVSKDGVVKGLRSNPVYLVIPDGAVRIDDDVFFLNKSLVSVVIPGSVKEIGDGAFQMCHSLKSVLISEGVIEIEKNAFFQSALESVSLPESLLYIGENAFMQCHFKSVVIPSNVKRIYPSAFQSCPLSDISFRGTKEQWKHVMKYRTWNLYVHVTVVHCSDGDAEIENEVNVVIPKGVTAINNTAYFEWKYLESVEIPEGVTAIGDYAFYECTLLDEIKYNGTVAQWDAVKKGKNCFKGIGATVVKCTDGEATL